MFVRSHMNSTVRYNKSAGSVELKPDTVTYVDESIVTAKELLDCYGERIVIILDESIGEVIEEQATEKTEAPAEKDDSSVFQEFVNKEVFGLEDGNEADTGNEEVDDFLNGKTDVVPEGTEEITEEEALKLKAQADAEAKAKEEAEKLEALKAKEAAEKAKAKEEAKAKSDAKSAKAPAKNKGNKKNNK